MIQCEQVLERDMRKNAGAGCDIYGSDRLRVALVVREILNDLNVQWYIESGTLLGAYRNAKFIPHDDDFDIALILHTAHVSDALNDLYKEIKKRLPAPLDCRLVDTYTDKLEIYDPTFGAFTLLNSVYNGADFHYVTVDLQSCVVEENRNTLRSTYRGKPFELIWSLDLILPLGTIVLEGETFPMPNKPKEFLEVEYGCIDAEVVYDEKTGKYRAKQ